MRDCPDQAGLWEIVSLLTDVGGPSPLWAGPFPWAGVPGLYKKAKCEPEREPATSILQSLCLEVLPEFLPPLFSVTWKCQANTPSPPLSCFWSVFFHNNKRKNRTVCSSDGAIPACALSSTDATILLLSVQLDPTPAALPTLLRERCTHMHGALLS